MISIDFQINLKTMFHLTRLTTSLQNRPPHHYDPINLTNTGNSEIDLSTK